MRWCGRQYGLCETLQQLHWFSEAASVETFVPRGYCIGHEDERTAFIHDYRLTACLNVLKWITERHDTHGPQAVADPHGEVSPDTRYTPTPSSSSYTTPVCQGGCTPVVGVFVVEVSGSYYQA